VGHPEYYSKFGFKNVPELTIKGVPQEVFFALAFHGSTPHGTVTFHEGVSSMSKFGTIDEYISSQPEERATLLKDLRDAILEAVPDAVEIFNYGVPAFALVKNGKRDQQIMIAGFKNHVGMYSHPTVINKFAKELSIFKQGKGKTLVDTETSSPILTARIKKYIQPVIRGRPHPSCPLMRD
jgi:uncharacterized protein YdhG (YjbR/CyaY superfamily)